MSRIGRRFGELAALRRKALVPFVTAGDPQVGVTVPLLHTLVAAGADVLYAPGPKTPADIGAIVAAAGGKPVNTLIYGDFGLSVSDIAATGTRRISIRRSFLRFRPGRLTR